MKIIKPSVKLLWITPKPEEQIEHAARTCYKSENRITKTSAQELIKVLIKNGHYAMIEHSVAAFRFVTDRGITHEIVRHRLASYAQESTRYCNYSKSKFGKEVSFIEPPDLDSETRQLWTQACLFAEKTYLDMLKNGCSPQIARSVLPNCLKTELVMMADFAEWRHFIKLRLSPKAHPQMRPLARIVLEILIAHAPTVFEDLTVLMEEGRLTKYLYN